MKRNMKLIQAILLAIQKHELSNGPMTCDLLYEEGMTSDTRGKVRDHCKMMADAGFIKMEGDATAITGIAWEGYELYERLWDREPLNGQNSLKDIAAKDDRVDH